ncbi:MAG: SDR family oxidoreductase [Kiritimatiellae bacterium]|nr:SDR family oxidoreductase [Kiritimatiellia bacterium]
MYGMLKGKTAIVTGAAQGIGKAIAARFLEEGANVVLCDIDEQKVREAAAGLDPSGARAVGLKADVTRQADAQAVVDATAAKFGAVDILVNNAGILKHALLVDMSEKDWDTLFAVNVKGSFLFAQAAAKVMIRQKAGKIINMSSCSGKKPTLEEGAYCSTKSAILSLNRVLALELGPYGINVNAICPGATDTEMVRSTFLTSPEIEQEWIDKTALKRLGKPEDQAKVALFLASDLSDHITGEALVVSAGEMMSQ